MIAAAPAGVLFEQAARPLLMVHAVLGFTALGTVSHLAAYAVCSARRHRPFPQLRRFGWLAPLTLAAQVLSGLALYPTYRVRVRFEHLARAAPAVAQLFDFKEHMAALALALAVAAGASALALDAREDASAPAPDPAPTTAETPSTGERLHSARWATAALAGSGAALTWIAALIGLYVTARHPVGMP